MLLRNPVTLDETFMTLDILKRSIIILEIRREVYVVVLVREVTRLDILSVWEVGLERQGGRKNLMDVIKGHTKVNL